MTANSQADARTPRLNPFVFPSDMDFRLVLLIVSVLGASVFIYDLFYLSFPENRELTQDTRERCWETATNTYPTDPFTSNVAFKQCTAPADRIQAEWIIGGLSVLLTVALVIYWTYPARIIRRDRLVPLSAQDAAEVVAYLSDLCREIGLSRPPTFVWNPLNPASSGLSFGRLRRYYVALTGGLVIQFYTDRAPFRAVLLHELAHMRNADVNKTYFTLALWQAFVVAVLVPFAIVSGISLVVDLTRVFSLSEIVIAATLEFFFKMGWRVLALAALVYLTRNAVLRAREMYADVRASVWDGPAGSLGRVLEALPHLKGSRWRSLLQVHPDPGERHRVLKGTNRLFRMGFWDAFGTGVAAAIAFPNIIMLLFLLTTDLQTVVLGPIWAALIFAPLAVGVVGLGAWRATFAAVMQREVPHDAGTLGLSLGLGFILGQALSFYSLIAGSTNRTFVQLDSINLVAPFGFDVLLGSMLLFSLFFFLRWIVAGASVWLEVVATYRSPRPAYAVGLTIAGGLLAVWLGFLFNVRDVWTDIPSFIASFSAMWLIGHDPLTLLALVSLWAFPLAAWFWRKNVSLTSGSSWAFLDKPYPSLTLPRRFPLCPGIALNTGMVGGIIFCGLLFALRIWLMLSVPSATRDTYQFILAFANVQVALAALMQALVAVVVAGRVKRLGGLHGLFAAFIAGSIMTGGVLGLNMFFGGSISPKFTWYIFSEVVNGGALLALLALGLYELAGQVRQFVTRLALVPRS